MAANDLFSSVLELPFGPLFQTLLPDFVLAFALFTALSYAVLGKRFDHQRPAVVMSAAVGLAHGDRKSTRLNSSHLGISRMPSSA